MSLTVKLASRNLFQDRLRFIATIVGIVFSMVLVNIQMGLFLSFERMVTTMIDHAPADLWIVPFGTKCFEDPSLLDTHDQALALAVPGVAQAVPVAIGFTPWTVPGGGTTPVFIVGSSTDAIGLRPWNVVKGNPMPWRRRTPSRSTRPISGGLGSTRSATAPKFASKRPR